MAKGEVRGRMVVTAARLLAEKGPSGASFGDVLRESGAARGSTYHHFPQGKSEMYDAALGFASQHMYAALGDVAGQPAEVVATKYFGMWRELLTRTDLRVGCAVLAVAVAGEDPDNVRRAGHIFGEMRDFLTSLFREAGLAEAQAQSLSATALAAAEGAVATARAEQSIEVFDLVAGQLIDLAARLSRESALDR